MVAARDVLDAFAVDGWSSRPDATLARLHDDQGPTAVLSLLTLAFDRQVAATTFLADAVSYVALDDLPALAAHAASATERGVSSAAADAIAHLSLQAPATLAPHLPRLWQTWPNERTYYAAWPWRGADADESERLLAVDDPSDRDRAAWAVLQTRDTAAIERLLAGAWAADREGRLDGLLAAVALERRGGGLSRISRETTYHLVFGGAETSRPGGLRHPTWSGDAVTTARAGGRLTESCGRCHVGLDRLLLLDPVPPGLGVSLARLDLVTCRACAGWEESRLHFRHDHDGSASPIARLDRPTPPTYAEDPVEAQSVAVVATADRWLMQDWALSNSRENLSRLGGEPSWLQSADYPTCPDCRTTMPLLAQLDTGPPMLGPVSWFWGSGGTAYVHWCDGCRISAMSWQCT